ncbi:MAG: 8-oxo-dGTP diphosphatase [Solobacterium sp.]|nr:8-oxo-dGTP diphosphatase [Solobacterium sp.]MCI7733055.1 8-oxo-dGTP diphosphatase [Solobacterium sp.]MDD5842971.1 8-oxo-dGTP diphosphatase [Solobacterium sp.]MDD5983206.1 8-oxo-dGTP diphosphatase [Solobacterium sp.]MDD6121968.1 8-oxo-dGTP diphosphatase [Solobacterium sp.]
MNRKQLATITNMCLVYSGDKILVQERNKKDWPGLTFPGGHVEKGENFIASVIREVKEETGLTIYDPLLCGMEEYKADNNDERYLMLFYKTDKFEGELKSSKEGKVFWINKDDLLKYELSLDLDRIYKIMTDDTLSELIYEYKNGEYISYIK